MMATTASHGAAAPGTRLLWSLIALACAALLGGCADQPLRTANASNTLRTELAPGVHRPASRPVVTAEPAEPSPPVMPALPVAPPEPRFDLIVNGAQARDVFLSMVTDTRYSMLMHPGVGGVISVTLKGVTMREALGSIRDVYGFDYKIEGRRVTVFPPTLQTRIFMVNYLHNQRVGRSDVRISSGAAPANNSNGANGSSTGGTAGAAGNNNPGGSPGSSNSNSNSNGGQAEGSQVSTSSRSDFWGEITDALKGMVGKDDGRAVITSPQAGTIAVRAMPDELRQIESFLRSTRLSVERQVMLEAKIVEVELGDGFQSGIDWSYLRGRGAIGQTSGSAANALAGNANNLPVLPAGVGSLLPVTGTGAIGMALASNGFQALLGFLETHGDIQILSSPRVATLNNQKAVLKVGTDDYFVTNIAGGTITTGTGSTGTITPPTITLTPFFSGIALDVTPQIDEHDMITLHVHPSVTTVTEKTKHVDLGAIGNYKLPLASSSVNETDTVVRIPDGQIVAIGGLMQMESGRQSSGLPGANSNAVTGTLFNNRSNIGRKKELVVLIKPTIIRSAEDWERITEQSRASVEELDASRRVITLDGQGKSAGQ